MKKQLSPRQGGRSGDCWPLVSCVTYSKSLTQRESTFPGLQAADSRSGTTEMK